MGAFDLPRSFCEKNEEFFGNEYLKKELDNLVFLWLGGRGAPPYPPREKKSPFGEVAKLYKRGDYINPLNNHIGTTGRSQCVSRH